MEQNPFSSLFTSNEEAALASRVVEEKACNISGTLSRIFLIKTRLPINISNISKYVVNLPKFGTTEGTLKVDNYEMALAERLQVNCLEDHLVVLSSGVHHGLYGRANAVESSKITYLFQCYSRVHAEKSENDPAKSQVLFSVKQTIAKMAGVMVCTLHNMLVLRNENPSEGEFVELLFSSLRGAGLYSGTEFFVSIANSQNPSNLGVTFGPFVDRIYALSNNLTIDSPNLHFIFDSVQFISQCLPLAKLLVDSKYWLPGANAPRIGKSYETHTILGRLLQPTSLPPSPMKPSTHFAELEFPARIDIVNSITASIQSQLEGVVSRLHTIVLSLVRQDEYIRNKVIYWLKNCFLANDNRGKMLSRLQGAAPNLTAASDGFFLNLSWVLLLLSNPISTLDVEGTNPRLLKIDPGYCTVLSRKRPRNETNESDRELVVDFSEETKLAQAFDDTSLIGAPPPVLPIKFITHCFYLTHKCLILGLTQTIHLYNDTRRILGRLHRMGGVGPMRMIYSQLLGIKAHAMNPQLLELCLTFYTATSIWLVELVKEDRKCLYPLPKQTPPHLQNIPECLVENLADFTKFLKESEVDILSTADVQQKHLLVFCTVFMGHSQLLHNPHLRAKLVQLVAMMIPQQDNDEDKPRGLLYSANFDNQVRLFESQKMVCDHLLESLLLIFIGIEHTGDSMEFEDKFEYRMPMYDILEFLWSSPAYSTSVKQLTDEAVVGLDMANTPLFLRFINMMINDAIVQLDEGLQSLMTIREVQILKESDQWGMLSDEDKKQSEEKLSEAVMYARNRNMLARKTVYLLDIITKKVTKPFVSVTMVDRMTAMLNYFLKKLIGPDSKDYDVKEKEKYNFDPRELVSSIISVYINLGKEESFCMAVHCDGRSFSMDLFDKALSVLRRIGKPSDMCSALIRVREKVRKYTHDQEMEELLSENAPNEFLDPILGTLMSDPVLLTTSGNIVDRATIIRHLLSEQFDPFNRVPLTPDMLQPVDELRIRIEEWKNEQIAIHTSSSKE